MGAFIVIKKSNRKNYTRALDLFNEMGFTKPQSLEVGQFLMVIYPKMITHGQNVISKNNCVIASIGSPIYKGLNYHDSLEALIQDYSDQCLELDQLLGQYTLLFCSNNTIEVLCDPLGSKHLFTNQNFDVLSSHMLPLCECVHENLHINKDAIYEKFLTGIIMSPNTIFQEIKQINTDVANEINQKSIGIHFIHNALRPLSDSKPRTTIKECISEQKDTLCSYFQAIKNACDKGVDIGLSGGYDSRLVLACLSQYATDNIHLHSHSTESEHKKDLQIAHLMAEYVKCHCNTIQTKKLKNCDNIDDILRKSILYFDGRSSYSIGGCGEVYTSLYRQLSTENTPYTLTGVGGEVYRNVFDIGWKHLRFDRFMQSKIFSSSFRNAIPKEIYNSISESVINKASTKLKTDQHRRQSKLIAYRYYCEIMMPEGQGTAIDAYNQVSCCNAPFLEPDIILKGYESIPFHHSGGEFEGKLIASIDPGLAAIPSSYGYPINKRPIKAKIKEGIRTYVPSSLWNKISSIVYRKYDRTSDSEKMKEVYANSETLGKAYAYLVNLFPEINFSALLQTGEEIRKVQFIAMTLYYFKERISTQ